jgi:hypothetical protein
LVIVTFFKSYKTEELDMIQMSDAQKQVRFRKKEQLQRYVEKIFREWESSLGRWRYSKRQPAEVRHALEQAANLPSGWIEEDYECAVRKLEQYRFDLMSSVDQITNDVQGDLVVHHNEFRAALDPLKFIADNKSKLENVRALADHSISGLMVSNCNPADQAAALMEAMRFVGRSLAGNREIHCSQATAMCLASIGPQFDRPAWFIEKLAEAIRQQIGENLACELGRRLSDP